MGEITINLPSDLESALDHVVSLGIYMGKEEAIITLIRKGLKARRMRVVPPQSMPDFPPVPPVRPPDKLPDHYEFK
jgi:hypothetical protein